MNAYMQNYPQRSSTPVTNLQRTEADPNMLRSAAMTDQHVTRSQEASFASLALATAAYLQQTEESCRDELRKRHGWRKRAAALTHQPRRRPKKRLPPPSPVEKQLRAGRRVFPVSADIV